jgi:hypothetical protein
MRARGEADNKAADQNRGGNKELLQHGLIIGGVSDVCNG